MSDGGLKVCVQCGAPYTRPRTCTSHAEWARRRFCSHACANEHNREQVGATLRQRAAALREAAGLRGMDTSWMGRAACRGMDTDAVFFPQEGRGRVNGMYERARQVCAACPVVDECRLYVMATEPSHERIGFVAGMTPMERRRFAAQRVAS